MALSPIPPNNCQLTLSTLSSSSSSPSPSSSSSSSFASSSSLYLLLFYSQRHSASRFSTVVKLKASFSRQCQEIHVDTRQDDPPIKVRLSSVKKKRKPKPSFSEQIQDKWSLRLDSTRHKFPWQVQEEEEEKENPHQPLTPPPPKQENGPKQEQLVGRTSSEVSDISINGYNSAPWVLGHRPQHNYKGEVSRFSAEEDEEVNGFCNFSANDAREAKSLYYRGVSGGNLRKNDDNADMAIESERLDFGGEDDALLNENAPMEDLVIGEAEACSDNAYVANTISIRVERKSLPFQGVSNALLNKYSLHETGVGTSVERPWDERDERKKMKSNTNMAERMIPEHELRRLRNVALRMLERIKVGNAGITGELVESIYEKWKVDEVVKLKFEGAHSRNMRRTHEILESRTGGLVIWRSGSSIVLYRGMAYKLPCVKSFSKQSQASASPVAPIGSMRVERQNFADSSKHHEGLSEEELMDMNELNQLLDELGPRFMDWSGCKPVPVDADLLPSVVPDYKTPFRLLPYGVRHCLRNKEMTAFRQLARKTPPHFALGRNRKLQGLARAMVKLWEKSAIAKIAIKRGVQNTCNDRMAEELKNLTGGTLLLRNKDYIVFYRGNDFLPPAVMDAVKERLELTNLQQNEEEQVRQIASVTIVSKPEVSRRPLVAGTLTETLAATSRWGNEPSSEDIEQMLKDSSLSKHESLVRSLQKKLSLAKRKVRKAEYALAKLQKNLDPSDLPSDLETVSDEERFLFRKMGLSMKPYLLVGRRGVFDGTVENVHLHWKHRELVKLIVRGQSFPQVKHLAISLEAESGGVLISLDKTTKGYAIILYRGKNYQRPHAMRPKNLLTRRQALARSIELQRREALRHHISDLQERIELLKSELRERRTSTKIVDDDDTALGASDSSSESDFMDEDEGEEAYLEVYDTENEDSCNEIEELIS